MPWRGKHGIWSRAVRWAAKQYRKTYIRYILLPLIVAGPSAFFAPFYLNGPFQEYLLLNFPPIHFLAPEKMWLGLLLPLLWTSILTALGNWIADRARTTNFTSTEYDALLKSLNSAEGEKLARIAGILKQPVTQLTNVAAAFAPQEHIVELARSCAAFFLSLQPADQFVLLRLVVLRMEKGQAVAVVAAFPGDHFIEPDLNVLNNANSALMIACRKNDLVVVENIEKQLKRRVNKLFHKGNDIRDNSGSLLCYPIEQWSGREHPWAITIHSEQPSYFKQAKAEVYRHFIHSFALRMRIEHAASKLVERCK